MTAQLALITAGAIALAAILTTTIEIPTIEPSARFDIGDHISAIVRGDHRDEVRAKFVPALERK